MRGIFIAPVLTIALGITSISGAPPGGTPALRPWTEYRAIMWVGDSAWKQPGKIPLFLQRLREMGINTGMVHNDGDLRPWVENRFPYYTENMVNRGLCLKFHSKVTDWDKFVTEWAKTGRPESALVRDYCLDDPAWRKWARGQMQDLARKNAGNQPLAYDIRDELSITISANPFDYDFNPIALSGFRGWLKTQYRELAALNAEWETQFATWDDVRPFTTDQVKNRMGSGQALPRGKPDWAEVQALKFDPKTAVQAGTRWNFSPWADFRTYMDLSLTRVLNELREAAREVDPRTPVGIEGTQMPHAFGGYDLWRLSQVLDWVEPYDIGNAREIFGAFMPGKPLVTTVFESDTAHASRRLWHLLLEGDRGCIIWWSEDSIDWNHPEYVLTKKAQALTPVLKEMTSPLARKFLRADRVRDPVLIHYSQPSIQVDWLLESTVDGSTWLRRFSSFEAEHNRQAKVRSSWLKAFQDLGLSPRFVASEQIEAGELAALTNAVLVLPSSWAISDKEAAKISEFARAGGTVCWDGTPGIFDEHGKLRKQSAFEELAPGKFQELRQVVIARKGEAVTRAGDIAAYHAERLRSEPDQQWARWIGENIKGSIPEIRMPLESRTRVHRFRAGEHDLVAFERNISYQMSEELKQAGGNEALEKPLEVEASLQHPKHVYDLAAAKYLGRMQKIRFSLDPWKPSMFGLTEKEVQVSALLGD